MAAKKSKSSVSMFGAAMTDLARDPAAEPKPATERVVSGVVSATKETALADLRDERDQLREKLEQATDVISISVDDIDPSPFPDRIEDEDSVAEFEELKASLATNGQQIAILVRPHPDSKGRYQVAYGHRRLRALKDLGENSVLAIIRTLDDEALLSAQGIENANRRNLTFIEKALFAKKLREQCQDKREEVAKVKSILSCTDADVSSFKLVLTAVPDEFIALIGPAPKIGKPRWVALAKTLSEADKTSLLSSLKKEDDFKALTNSNERFEYINAYIAPNPKRKKDTVELAQGALKLIRSGKQLTISAQDKHFCQWLEKNMEDFYARYRESN